MNRCSPGPERTEPGAASPLGSSSQPGDEPDTHGPPIWPCSRWGLAAVVLPRTAGRSYRPISPLPTATEVATGGMFLCHFPSPTHVSAPTPGSYPAPCPVEPGLSSPRPLQSRGGHPAVPAFSWIEASIGVEGGQGMADGHGMIFRQAQDARGMGPGGIALLEQV